MRVREALEAIGAIVSNLVLAIRGASAITLLAAALVLGGALAAGHRHRVYDAVVLKMLGATRGRLLAAYALEYLLIGARHRRLRRARGSLAGWLIVTDVMNLRFAWLPWPALAAAIGALAVTVALGLIGTSAPSGKNRRRCCGIYRFLRHSAALALPLMANGLFGYTAAT